MTRSDLWGHSFKMYYACKIYYSKDHKVRFLKYAKILVLTLNSLTTTIVAPPSNASKWQMGFNLAFKGLTNKQAI